MLTETNSSLCQESEDNLIGLFLESMVIQETFKNVILKKGMCGILCCQLQYIALNPKFWELFQQEVEDFNLSDLEPVPRRKQSILPMYLDAIAACCFCFAFFLFRAMHNRVSWD